MECKFKPITKLEESIHLRNSEAAAGNTISNLLNKVAEHMYSKTTQEKANNFLKNTIIDFQVDSVKQVYQSRPRLPNTFFEEQSPRKEIKQCLRPMSAQVRQSSPKNNRPLVESSQGTINSHGQFGAIQGSKRNHASMSNINEPNKGRRKYEKTQNSYQKKFFAVKNSFNDDDPFNEKFIQELRLKKLEEENQLKKKQEFLKSIQLQSTNFTQAQAKFIKSINRKKFIYGSQGQIIEINKSIGSSHLKKISTISRSRVQVRTKLLNEVTNFHGQQKENIYIGFKGRQTYQSRTQQTKPTQVYRPQEMKNNFLSVKETKKSKTSGFSQILPKTEDRLNSVAETRTQIQFSIMNEEEPVKKKPEKILFYQSANSVYRVVQDVQAFDLMENSDSLNG